MLAPARPLDARLYRLTVRLCPARFRDDYAHQMAGDFDDGRREASAAGSAELWRFRGRMTADLFRTIVVQWMRSGVPAIALLSSLAPLLLVPALAALWRSSQFAMPIDRADADVIGLAVLATVTVLLVATTILLTLRVLQPVLRRHQRR